MALIGLIDLSLVVALVIWQARTREQMYAVTGVWALTLSFFALGVLP